EAASDAFAGVRYTVFGCGNREWNATYQSVPRLIDERIAELGGIRIAPRGEGDARDDLDGQYEDWFAALRPKAAEAFGLQASLDRETRTQPLYSVEPASKQDANPAVHSAGAKRARVLENRELLTAPDRSTRHIEVALPEGATYRAGDHLAVVPRNDAALVAAIAKRLGHSPDDVIRLRGAEGRRAQLPLDEPVSVGKLLADFVEVQQVATRKQIQTMAEHTRCPVTRPKLEALSGESDEAYRAEVLGKRKSVYDLLEEHPACELPLSAYLEMTPLLQPRYYSISSSPKNDPQRCTVTVGVVEGPARSGRGVFKGVCSNYLAGRAAEETVFAAVRETKAGFRLPDDTKTPLVMIGPGTGLAPFRSFLQERAALKKAGATLGPAMLFFGCRRPDQDYLYADELKAYAADGIVELHTAFSRMDGQPKTYVQDLVRAQQDRVWELIEAGAIVYICGDGGKMEPDVKRALVEIYCARKNASPEQGEAWINEMGATNRYVLDVWAGS
ncbi:MAG: flavodoxin domain-containing protein, partial [Hyphomicrobiales bacterium]|nr:flavodoxin domain-containing protein [Hyphomicrobiales bacterium]